MLSAKREARLRELCQIDQIYWAAGIRAAGIDEAGRGPLAGPVVAACVVLPPEPLIEWVDDSKKLSAERREQVYEQIMAEALYVGVGRVEAEEIDRINILQATRLAMQQAAASAAAQAYLIDAMAGLGLDGEERAIVHGDRLCYHIAAASIVAKVTRDREMIRLDSSYPEYGFARHKGYGTAAHIAALRAHGPCPLHRRSFIGRLLPP